MNHILAAIDNSAAARPVLSMAKALGEILNASAAPLHVSDDRRPPACVLAESFGMECEVTDGDAFETITWRAGQDDVLAVVVGARSRLEGRGIGHLTRQIADAVDKPVLVVPPETPPTDRLRKVIIAMEGTPANARNLKATIDVAAASDVALIIVHVDDEDSIPSFGDQIAHETAAYAHEFLARYLHGAPEARLELRVGIPADEILRVTDALAADVLALGWPHVADPHRGATARQILDRSHLPVLLVALA